MSILTFNNVHYRYPGTARWALSGVSLAIPGGQRIGLIGRNGSGKSTLILHCNGLLRPELGAITFQESPDGCRRASPRELRQLVGIAFQNPDDQLFSDDVAQDIAFGPGNLGLSREEVARRVDDAARTCEVAHLLDRPVHALSGGEKTRVALAGVLAMEPDIVIVDEVLSALDPWMRRQMLALLDGLVDRGKTVIVATHDWELVRFWADSVIWLDDGKVAAVAPPEQLFDDLMQEEFNEHFLPPACAGCTHSRQRVAAMSRPQPQAGRAAIVLVFFGTTSAEGRKVYDHIERETRRRHPGREVRQALLSEIVIRKLRSQGTAAANLDETMSELKRRGFGAAAIMPLLIVPGQEYERVKGMTAIEGIKTSCGLPLMTSEGDIDAVLEAIAPEIRADRPCVIACHGNASSAAFNDRIMALDARARARWANAVVASVEGSHPGTAPLARARELAHEAGAVHFIPMMIVAGDHVMHDIMGDEADSWKRIVDARETTCAPPLGLNDAVLEVYYKHLDQAIKQVET